MDLIPQHILKLYKMWAPGNPMNYCFHVVYGFHITGEQKKKVKTTGRFANKMKWINDTEALKYLAQEVVETPIILDIFYCLRPDPKLEFKYNAPEILVTESLVEITESVLMDGSQKAFEQMLETSGLKMIQLQIYKEFLRITFPNIFMTASVFNKFITAELGLPKEDAIFLFRAADFADRKFLTFRDFLNCLAAVDPNTTHGGLSGELRCRYIFRFFDRDKDGNMNYSELRNIVMYLRKSKGQPTDSVNVEKELLSYSQSLNITESKPLTLGDFLRLAGELKIRGMSQLLRIPKSMKTYMQAITLAASSNSSISTMIPSGTSANAVAQKIAVESAPKTARDRNAYAKGNDFEIAAHSIKIQKSGTIINLEEIWSLPAVSSITTLFAGHITEDNRRLSIDLNTQTSACNELIKNLRYLVMLNKAKSGNRGNRKEQYSWGTINSNTFGQRLMTICYTLRNILKDEPRLLDLRSPMYILGDFHGNYGDLQYFERMFWPLCPGYCPCSLLFLGDYVDRGPFGVEVVTYLFCYKTLYPNKIKLIRGNHEIRDVQKMFTFQSECVGKFGEKFGNDVWECINSVFDYMPLAAVVDGKLFCCHGGIPPPWLCPIATAINHIPVPLSQPDMQSSLAWEIMWNDPIKDKMITAELNVELQANDGFAQNVKRGTAHVFSCDGLDRFLNVNGFTHVIRAHEMAPAGYNVLHKGKLMTIFSTSKYSGQQNEAACILVDQGKLRMMRLDTT